ncbi:hypothetical protein Osc7112_6516 (plasmid) [Oscillatoria nigro-viridis PCC 7112]|uniref:Conjugation TrbI family protein n=1 Tax=Phormidium nigroviride PCC 7112 TaxID=179408 RepID=K9VRE3_9CYAN|nr:hypothetical protein [Oscillatoria nigro-viridis]AFZ10658.1 hypothetical protein Osc7112_6516 [Oscillatoria nigro-viridis PCC 7112]
MTNTRNGLTENPINTTPDNSTTTANMNHTTASSEYTPNNDDDNINSPISPSPNPSPSDDDIDENFIANFDPNAPLTLETQYQLAQDEERPLPPPVSERGVPRAVTMLLLTGGILLLGLLIWQFIKPKSPREPIAQSTPKESSSPTIKDEKPELLAKLAYQDQQKLLAEKPQKTAKPKTEPSPKPSRTPRTPRTPRLVATRSAAPPPTPLREPLPAPRTVVRTVTVPAPIPQRVPSRTPAPAPILKPLVPPPLIPTPTSEKIDPFERWNQLAQLGQIRGNFDPNRIANAVSATPSTPATTSATAAALTKPAPTTEFLTVNIGNQKSQPSYVSFEQIPQEFYNRPNNVTGERLHPEFPAGEDSLETTDNSQNSTNQLTPAALSPQTNSDFTDNPIETATRLSESQTSLPDTEFQTLSPEAAPEASTLTNSPTLEQVNSPGAKGILNRTPQSSSTSQTAIVPLGTTANGIVSVPLLWDEGSGKQLYDKFAVTLTADFTATDGSIAFPAGTVVIAKANTVSKTNRMVQASAVALVYSDRNGQIKQQPIPEGAILIAGEGGRPLIASGYFDPGSDIAGQDILTAVLSGVGRVGQVFAEPKVRSSSSISGRFGSSTTTVESRDPQIWSAVLDGFFSPLAKRMESRSDRATEELLNRPNVAVVNKGTPVSITVNSFLNIYR